MAYICWVRSKDLIICMPHHTWEMELEWNKVFIPYKTMITKIVQWWEKDKTIREKIFFVFPFNENICLAGAVRRRGSDWQEVRSKPTSDQSHDSLFQTARDRVFHPENFLDRFSVNSNFMNLSVYYQERFNHKTIIKVKRHLIYRYEIFMNMDKVE